MDGLRSDGRYQFALGPADAYNPVVEATRSTGHDPLLSSVKAREDAGQFLAFQGLSDGRAFLQKITIFPFQFFLRVTIHQHSTAVYDAYLAFFGEVKP